MQSRFFSLISLIISCCPLSVHRKACVLDMITSSKSLAKSTNLSQSTFLFMFIPHWQA
ncbi:MAG: hypothetical protein KGD67_10260 [Candidatus Lokiarchaeota archaeon]|nr:hypothetical protein [Candidatus Lokiarchaeota archaeon]